MNALQAIRRRRGQLDQNRRLGVRLRDPGARRCIGYAAFPVNAGGGLSSFVTTVRVGASGRLVVQGLLRLPYQNRPKRGGGRAVRESWMNPAGAGHV